MIRIRYENVDPVIVDLVQEYDYCLRDGVFELSYWIQEDTGLPPVCLRVATNFNYSNKIFLELETHRWTRKYSFAESPAVLMTAMSDYETEINLETITQEIDD